VQIDLTICKILNLIQNDQVSAFGWTFSYGFYPQKIKAQPKSLKATNDFAQSNFYYSTNAKSSQPLLTGF
jgi:hypothetical protein